MNLKSKPTKPQELASRLQLARLERMKAEGDLKNAKERTKLAKRRRKEAKQAFRRARKEVKRAKIELAKTEEVIVETEAKLRKAMKAQTREQPKVARRATAQARRAGPSGAADKAATQPNRKRPERNHISTSPPAVKIAPKKVTRPEPNKREISPSVVETNSMPV